MINVEKVELEEESSESLLTNQVELEDANENQKESKEISDNSTVENSSLQSQSENKLTTNVASKESFRSRSDSGSN